MRYLLAFLFLSGSFYSCSEAQEEKSNEIVAEKTDATSDDTYHFEIMISSTNDGYKAVLNAEKGELQIFDNGAFVSLDKQEDAYIINHQLPQLGRIVISMEEQLLLVLQEGEIIGKKEGEKVVVKDENGENQNLQWFNDLYNEFNEQQQELLTSIQAKGNLNQSVELQKEYTEKLASLDEDFEKKLKAFNDTITPSFVGMLATSRLFKEANMAYLESVLKAYSNKEEFFYATDMVNEFNRRKATSIGFKAPDFTLNSLDGKKIKLSSLRGKVVLIDFWASWCGPCRKENPNVLRMYNAYKNKGFDILGVSLDKDRDQWVMAIDKDGLSWNHVWDEEGRVAEMYSVNAIPHTILLNEKGEIIAKNLRGKSLEDKLKEVL